MLIIDKDELEKMKKDPVYFAEKYLGSELLPWQKFVLRNLHRNEKFHVFGIRSGRRYLDYVLREYARFIR